MKKSPPPNRAHGKSVNLQIKQNNEGGRRAIPPSRDSISLKNGPVQLCLLRFRLLCVGRGNDFGQCGVQPRGSQLTVNRRKRTLVSLTLLLTGRIANTNN